MRVRADRVGWLGIPIFIVGNLRGNAVASPIGSAARAAVPDLGGDRRSCWRPPLHVSGPVRRRRGAPRSSAPVLQAIRFAGSGSRGRFVRLASGGVRKGNAVWRNAYSVVL